MNNTTKNILSLCVLGAVLALTRNSLASSWRYIRREHFPCTSPIEYSIGTFDTKFGLSEKEFLRAITQAEQVWEDATERNLFKHTEDGYLKIHLIYDNRQDATVRLQQTTTQLDERKESYQKIKDQYTLLKSDYLQLKQAFESASEAYVARQNTYNSAVEEWNSRGGAPSNEYTKLDRERLALDQERQRILILQNKVNARVDELNKTSTLLNKQVETVNEQVHIANKISTENGDEFQEGEYSVNRDGEKINIYQYDNHDKLVRLLVHELGHALQMNHVDDPGAIMYRLNEGEALIPTAADRAELARVCKL